MEWVLIFVVSLGSASNPGLSTGVVGGFTTLDQCDEAGKATIRFASPPVHSGDNVSYICVQRGRDHQHRKTKVKA